MTKEIWKDYSRQLVLKDLQKSNTDVDFAYISKYRYLIEDIMLNYVSKLKFEDIVCRQPISEKILDLAVKEKLKRKEDIQRFVNQIVAYQEISQNFVNKYKKYIDINELNRKINMYRESFDNVMAYLDRIKEVRGNLRAAECALYKTIFCSTGEFIMPESLPANEYTICLDIYELYEGFEYDNRLREVINKIAQCEKKLIYCPEKDVKRPATTLRRLQQMGFFA